MSEEPSDEPINADPTYAPLIEAERQAAEDAAQDQKGRGVLRFYELAKKQEWQVRDLAWGEVKVDPWFTVASFATTLAVLIALGLLARRALRRMMEVRP